jgi:hypothetical protein
LGNDWVTRFPIDYSERGLAGFSKFWLIFYILSIGNNRFGYVINIQKS